MAFIEQLGVRNLIVEAREAADGQALQKVRKLSAGLDASRTCASSRSNSTASPRPPRASASRRRSCCRKPQRRHAGGLRRQPGLRGDRQPAHGRRAGSSTRPRPPAAAPVAVLGEAAAAALFGADDPVGQYVKVNEQWFQVIGVAGPQLTVQADVAGLPAQDRNNLIYVPLYSAIFRLEDGQSSQQGRDRRHLPADAVERRRAVGRGAGARHARRRRTAAPATSPSSRRPSCSPSSGARSGSSRW